MEGKNLEQKTSLDDFGGIEAENSGKKSGHYGAITR